MTAGTLKESNSKASRRLALGTVQFGQSYGISNSRGKPSEKNVQKIIDFALKNDITTLDTAPAYGRAEIILGRMLNPAENFKIITKTYNI